MKNNSHMLRIALLGNPNSGKTAIFNRLTGSNYKVSNYPGVTVQVRRGRLDLGNGRQAIIADYPGTYSLTPESFDEQIVAREVVGWLHGENPPDVVVVAVDATNLARNLYFVSQLLDLGLPVVVALNMMDLVPLEERPDPADLSRRLGVEVVPMSALEGWGFERLREAILRAIERVPEPICHEQLLSEKDRESYQPLVAWLSEKFNYSPALACAQALRLVGRDNVLRIYLGQDHQAPLVNGSLAEELQQKVSQVRSTLQRMGSNEREREVTLRYKWVDRLLSDLSGKRKTLAQRSLSEKIDDFLLHPALGLVAFLVVFLGIFAAVFSWAQAPMNWIQQGMELLSQGIEQIIPAGLVRDMLLEGVIGGVGTVLTFLPQILVLIFFLTLLEDLGYMARVTMLLDSLMRKAGLNGRSVFPLMSGYACAIPGILAARTVNNRRQRLVTILVLPLMSCSARLPVYALMIAAFIPSKEVLPFLNLQALVLLGLYLLGTVSALVLARLLSRWLPEQGQTTFIMELPPYRRPVMRAVWRQVYDRAAEFVRRAGGVILAVSIVLWFLASFPRDPQTHQAVPIDQSYAAQMGKALEPVLRPLGFDWKLGVGLVTSFAAREVMVSTLATLYNVAENQHGMVDLTQALREDRDPRTGKPLYNIWTALALLVFFVYAAQCMATFAVVRVETRSWKWPVFMVVYLTTLAYLAALIVYQVGPHLVGG